MLMMLSVNSPWISPLSSSLARAWHVPELDVPTIRTLPPAQRDAYAKVLCDTLNARARNGYQVFAKTDGDAGLGIGLVVLEKTTRNNGPSSSPGSQRPRRAHQAPDALKDAPGTPRANAGLKVFDGDLLYITKPLGQRFWTATATNNDADDIANTIYERSLRGAT